MSPSPPGHRRTVTRNHMSYQLVMSFCRTLKLRSHNPIHFVANALRTYVQTGTLPAMPEAVVADG